MDKSGVEAGDGRALRELISDSALSQLRLGKVTGSTADGAGGRLSDRRLCWPALPHCSPASPSEEIPFLLGHVWPLFQTQLPSWAATTPALRGSVRAGAGLGLGAPAGAGSAERLQRPPRTSALRRRSRTRYRVTVSPASTGTRPCHAEHRGHGPGSDFQANCSNFFCSPSSGEPGRPARAASGMKPQGRRSTEFCPWSRLPTALASPLHGASWWRSCASEIPAQMSAASRTQRI